VPTPPAIVRSEELGRPRDFAVWLGIEEAGDDDATPMKTAVRVQSASSFRVALLREDFELAERVPSADRERACRTVLTPVLELAAGTVDLSHQRLTDTAFALLVIDGTLTYEVAVGGRAMIEFAIRGDVLSPWPPPGTAPDSHLSLSALDDVRLAVLDHRFITAAAAWPGLMIAIQRRLHDQQHRLAAHGAICQLPHVEQRVMAIMWHLAFRTGRVTIEGTVVPHPLSHRALARLIGASRPTVSLAISSLQRQGCVRRRDDGTWLLVGWTGEEATFEDLVARLAHT
jgi:CRP/FNR family transcriptional regulator, cyclic AMP receptor protein